MRHLLLSCVLAGASLFGLSAQAADLDDSQYVTLEKPVAISKPGKIEVVELFWYGCGHCYKFESTINPWIAELPEDVNFVRIPAMFGGVWNVHGQVFITLEAMGVEQKVHHAVFDAIHVQHKKLDTVEDMAEFLQTQGVDSKVFLSTYNSFAVKGQVEKAKKLAAAYQITGVPTMIVNGKYRFDLGTSGGPDETLQVADQLIAKERTAE